MIPYGRQWVDEEDIEAVVQVLRSDWLTTGPMIEKFEEEVARFVGGNYSVAVSNGTAALHAAMKAAGIGPGDEVILPPMTFVATANAVVFQGGIPVFADVDPDSLLIDPKEIESRITCKTKAIVAVDYAGQPCDYDILRDLAHHHGLTLVADACHSLGGEYGGRKVGSLADMTVFSFHPVKPITTGEGGMVVTNSQALAEEMKMFRNHGISTDHRQRESEGSWLYEMEDLGFNYRITDFQCALGMSQLKKLSRWIRRRREIARCYDEAFAENQNVHPLRVNPGVSHAYHLYVVRLDLKRIGKDRKSIFRALRDAGIGVNVHYIPVYAHPFYKEKFGFCRGLCPRAEEAYENVISLPIFPAMSSQEVDTVIQEVCTRVGGKRPWRRCS
ncbi:MAG: UDP-4-amino-4,6-dideoxy-N-acetyl-beta-L-altrosamine transaminase [Syntrophales bacterium LBB04]|nr:UDP-4-amino-4,6-dideoxy-N-acetyl-beta-L-altrosamine transaminase [Syntrophales bacterium LBB04]